jgi:hypothetical protein
MAPTLCFHRDITISTFFHCRVEIAKMVERIGLKNSIVPAGLGAIMGAFPALRVRLRRTGFVPGYIQSPLRG